MQTLTYFWEQCAFHSVLLENLWFEKIMSLLQKSENSHIFFSVSPYAWHQPLCYAFSSKREVEKEWERNKEEKDHSISILFSFLKSILFGQTVIVVSNDTNLKGNRRRLQTGLWAYQQEYVATNCRVNETACCFLSLSLWVLCQSIWGGARAPGGVKDTCWALIGAHCC